MVVLPKSQGPKYFGVNPRMVNTIVPYIQDDIKNFMMRNVGNTNYR